MPKHHSIVIAGAGRLGRELAVHFSSQGHSVVVVDHSETALAKLPFQFSGFKLQGNAGELATLRQVLSEKIDILIAATDNDNLNLMVAQAARDYFQVPKVMARVAEPASEPVYARLRIEAINPHALVATAFLRRLGLE
jgi:trk system potassium uptake protein TrkA